MRPLQHRGLCLALAAACFSSLVAEAADASAVQSVGAFLGTKTTAEEEGPPGGFHVGEATLLVPRDDEPKVDVELPGQANRARVSTEELAAKVYELGDAYPGSRRGLRTALLGLVGLVLFLVVHFAMQYKNGEDMGVEELMLSNEKTHLSMKGMALIASLVVMVTGVTEALLPQASGRAASFDTGAWPSRGTKHTVVGRALVAASILVLVVGFFVGLPVMLKVGAEAVLVSGSTLALLGVILLCREIARSVKLAKNLYSLAVKDVHVMQQDGQLDPELLMQLMDHFLSQQGPLQEALLASLGKDGGGDISEAMEVLAASAKSGEKERKAMSKAISKELKGAMAAAPELLNAETLGAVAQQLQLLQEQQLQQQEAAVGTPEERLGDVVASLTQTTLKELARDVKKNRGLMRQASAMQRQAQKQFEAALGDGTTPPLKLMDLLELVASQMAQEEQDMLDDVATEDAATEDAAIAAEDAAAAEEDAAAAEDIGREPDDNA